MIEQQFEESFDISLSDSQLFLSSEAQDEQQKNGISYSLKSLSKSKKKNGQKSQSQGNEIQFIEDLQETKKRINKKFSSKIKKTEASDDYCSEPTIFQENKNKTKFNKYMTTLFTQFEERRIEKQIIALTIINKQDFNLKTVRQQFHKSKPEVYIQRDKKRTLCRGVAVDFIRGLERYLKLECGYQLEPMKKDNVTFITKVLMECKKRMKVEMCNETIAFLKYIYDLGDVKLNHPKLMQMYNSLSELSEELILGKYQANMKKNRPHQLPISLYSKLWKAEKEGQTKEINLSELNRSWTQQHENYLIELYKQNQSFAVIRQRFRIKFPEEYHIWTYNAIQLRIQRVMRQCLKVLRQIAYHKNHRNLPKLVQIDSQLTRIISLRVPFRQIRLKLLKLLENNKDMTTVRWLIQNINYESQKWKEKKQEEYDQKSKIGTEDFEEELTNTQTKKKKGKRM